jgi:hypothetical protein
MPLSVRASNKEKIVNILLVIIIVVAVILAITGGLVESLNFLLWVGIILAVIAIIAWLIRSMSGRNKV